MDIQGTRFVDQQGRTLMLRGVNLGGSSKVPARPNGATYVREGFFDHRTVSFVGRPFPLDEADEHFSRLRAWGLTFLRLLTTWEAVEHGGPGIYDEEYLDYLEQIVRRAGQYGMTMFIDPHQDVWSRFSGGDGAPGWTFEAVGLDITKFRETAAAVVHATHGDPFPRMIWPTNYDKLATATMFTLFFGGNDFAPKTEIDGEPAQEYLQRHYIEAMGQIARRLRGLPRVVGYDTLNEPSPGYIGRADLTMGGYLRLGASPTLLQGMALGEGIAQEVGSYDMGLLGPRARGRTWVNTAGERAWLPDKPCIWRQHGVWDCDGDGQPRLLRPNHFLEVNGRRVEFANDYLKPFLLRFARAIRAHDPDAIIFLEGAPGGVHPCWTAADPQRVVNAAHWYDGLTLFTKDFRPWLTVDLNTRKLAITPWKVDASFARQLARISEAARGQMGGIPTLIGEVGIPFDMRGKEAYRTGDFSRQMKALDASMRALEAELLSYTLWNYTADNDNAHGDQWNDEDLSIFSRDQQGDPSSLDSGGRALEAAVRPYARATAGEPLRMSFHVASRVFQLEFRHDPSITSPTEVFLPRYQYPDGCTVNLSDGSFELDWREQVLTYQPARPGGRHQLTVHPR